MLELKNVSVTYGTIRALRGVDLVAQPGQITAVLGANGAGKSSLLRAIAGIAPVSDGDVLYRNASLKPRPAHQRARMGISLAMEGRRLFRHMSVEENLLLAWSFGPRHSPFTDAVQAVYDAFPILGDRRSIKAGMLLGGQQQMLILSSVTIREPDLMLLDEPSLGLAPIIVSQIFDFITAYSKARGTAVVLAEQMAVMALRVAHWGYVLRGGQVVMHGASDELVKADIVNKLSAAYL